MNVVPFMRGYDGDPYVKRWLTPLLAVLSRIGEREARQRVLQYGAVVHASIDMINKKHVLSKSWFRTEEGGRRCAG